MVKRKASRWSIWIALLLVALGLAVAAEEASSTCGGLEELVPGCKHRRLLLIELTTGDIETTITFKDEGDPPRVNQVSDARLGTSASRSKHSSRTITKSTKDKDNEASSNGLLSSAAAQGLLLPFWSTVDSGGGIDRVIAVASPPENCPPPDKARTFCDNPVGARNQLLSMCMKLRSEGACCEFIRNIRAGSGWGEFQACTCSPQTVCDLEPFVNVAELFSSCGVALHGLPGC